jgi:hypothetical protein
MSFLRHGEIYRPIQKPERPALDRPQPHRYDEFPAGYSLAGCAPAEPASASPAVAHSAGNAFRSTIKKQRTANHLLYHFRPPIWEPPLAMDSSWVLEARLRVK